MSDPLDGGDEVARGNAEAPAVARARGEAAEVAHALVPYTPLPVPPQPDGIPEPLELEPLPPTVRPAPLLPTAQRTRTFARGLWRIAAADVSADNRVHLLQDGPATFDAMIAAIDGATTRVDFEGYIFRDDEVGRRFRDALIDAAMRGVQVRVLVDWVGRMGTPRAFFREMTRFGV